MYIIEIIICICAYRIPGIIAGPAGGLEDDDDSRLSILYDDCASPASLSQMAGLLGLPGFIKILDTS